VQSAEIKKELEILAIESANFSKRCYKAIATLERIEGSPAPSGTKEVLTKAQIIHITSKRKKHFARKSAGK
jgi:hypothetical protein